MFKNLFISYVIYMESKRFIRIDVDDIVGYTSDVVTVTDSVRNPCRFAYSEEYVLRARIPYGLTRFTYGIRIYVYVLRGWRIPWVFSVDLLLNNSLLYVFLWLTNKIFPFLGSFVASERDRVDEEIFSCWSLSEIWENVYSVRDMIHRYRSIFFCQLKHCVFGPHSMWSLNSTVLESWCVPSHKKHSHSLPQLNYSQHLSIVVLPAINIRHVLGGRGSYCNGCFSWADGVEFKKLPTLDIFVGDKLTIVLVVSFICELQLTYKGAFGASRQVNIRNL